jgi:hypothetical protein
MVIKRMPWKLLQRLARSNIKRGLEFQCGASMDMGIACRTAIWANVMSDGVAGSCYKGMVGGMPTEWGVQDALYNRY